jgi:hypothetical protein
VDGVRGGKSFKDGLWQGFEGTDVTMTIDLGKKTSVSEFSVRFMQEISSWVFLPVRVEFYTSADGRDFFRAGVQEAAAATAQSENGPRDFTLSVPGTQARFVRMRATSILTCPSWHPGAGKKSWLFVDEIVVK